VTGQATSVPFHDRSGAEDFLRGLATAGEGRLPLADAALALAARDRPLVDLAPYHRHLQTLAHALGEAAVRAGDLSERAAALGRVLFGGHGYQGDTLTYEDLENANLIRVVDRRKGLPVALGILYIHAGRAQGWDMAGLAFPGHFLIRIEDEGGRVILDPFHGGKTCAAAELRDLLKATLGNEAELAPTHYAAVSDREILLRLQNNLKIRLIQSRQIESALAIIEGMMLFAPDHAPLWRESALLHVERGNLRAAIAALERFLALAADGAERRQAAAFLQKLKSRMN
jgi:regulator of sirC expression with transglutaminase-like and TPR domain